MATRKLFLRFLIHLGTATCIFIEHVEAGFGGHNSWDHDILSENGPHKWNTSWPACGGTSQSPVNIDTSQVWYSNSLIALDMIGYDTIPPGAHWVISNIGYTVQVTLDGEYKILDGGLPGVYKVSYILFHWGLTERTGSEHTINGNTYAMELQIIHYNTKYQSYDAALANEDGLAIVAFLFKIGHHGNAAFTQILNSLESITTLDASVVLRPIPLFSLAPVNVNNYYRYKGSLTVPPCLEIAEWTVFSDIATISENQLEAFRKYSKKVARSAENKHVSLFNKMKGNSRPLAPLGSRTMYSSNPDDSNMLTSPTGTTISIILAVSVGFLILLLGISWPLKDYQWSHED